MNAPRRLALPLMLCSGFAGLGYQIVWTQQGALWLGHEEASVLAVVTAFFGGLALGAAWLGGRIARSAQPARGYALCELTIGAWSLVLAGLAQPVSQRLLALMGPQPSPAWQWTVAFGGTFLLLLPATAAMGATLPALERALPAAQGRSRIAALYAANTFGAMLGVLACAFWLVPAFGLRRTALACAALNLACARVAWTWPRAAAAAPPAAPAPADRRLPLRLAATGLLGIGYEVLVVRVLSQVAENTVYTFALLLAVYLVGTAIGAAAWQRWGHRLAADRRDERLLGLLGGALLLGGAGLWGAESLKATLLQVWGAGVPAGLTAEATLALAAFGPPTLVMGALFSHLGQRALQQGLGLGRALSLNTLGAALAPLLVGVLLLPAIGAKAALLALVAGYLLLAWRAWASPWVWTPAAALVVAAVMLPPLVFVDRPEGAHLLSYREGATAAVSVVEDAQGVARLRIDNRQQEGSNATLPADARQALLPLLLHPGPQRALFLGLGTGVTAASAAADARLQVDAVELLPEVIDASAFFTAPLLDGLPQARLRIVQADARRYVRTAATRYDVIVSDNFHPARSGSAALYTVEHFQAVRARLASGGLFCQWLPLHQMDLATLRPIVKAFLAAFPQGGAMLATLSLDTPVLGLVAQAEGRPLRLDDLHQRLQHHGLPQPPSAFGLHDALALAGSLIAGPSALARFAADAPLNTDDHPVVAYLAPAATYATEARPRDRLLALLPQLDLQPGELIDAGAQGPRLAAYRQARDRFLLAGREVQPTADVRRMLAQVQAPLLAVLAISPDFRPAYDPLLRMAQALGTSDPAGARALLEALRRAQPARQEAAGQLSAMASR